MLPEKETDAFFRGFPHSVLLFPMQLHVATSTPHASELIWCGVTELAAGRPGRPGVDARYQA
jgi:hypothetical protein